MNTIFFISSNGFPSNLNKNTGIFTFEQAKAIKCNANPILIDLQTNLTNKIYCEKLEGILIYRFLYTKFNLIKIFKNISFMILLIKEHKPYLLILSFLNLKNVLYTFYIKVKKIIIIHGSDSIVKNIFKKFIYENYLLKVNKIITVSKYTKKIFFKHFKNPKIHKKTKVVHNGFSNEKLLKLNRFFLKKIPKNKIIISCVANLIKRKNICFLIEVFNLLNLRNPNKYFLIIAGGNGDDKKNILNLISKYNLEKKILIKQNLSNSEISTILNTSNFFCLFSKNYKREFEGFGIVYLEAMFTKNVIFSAKEGGVVEIVKNNINGLSFNLNSRNSIKKIVNKIEIVQKNKKMSSMLIKNAFNHSLKFSWEKNIKKIIS